MKSIVIGTGVLVAQCMAAGAEMTNYLIAAKVVLRNASIFLISIRCRPPQTSRIPSRLISSDEPLQRQPSKAVIDRKHSCERFRLEPFDVFLDFR